MYIKLCHEEQRSGLGSRVVCIYPELSLDEIRGGRKGSDSPFDLFYPSPPSRLFLSYTPPVAMDVAEMGAQPRRPRRLQTFLSELFTELQFLVFATFLYITDPSLASSLRQLFLYSSFSVSFFFFFYRYITDRFSFVLASINQEK